MVTRVDYSNDTTSVDRGPSSSARYGGARGCGSYGCWWWIPIISVVDRIDYSNDTTLLPKGPLGLLLSNGQRVMHLMDTAGGYSTCHYSKIND